MHQITKIFLLLLIAVSSFAQQQIRVMAYNVKGFPSNNNVAADLKIVLNQIKPTILLTVELDGSNAVSQFLNNVLSTKYKASTEVDIKWGTGNECAVFYVDSLLTYLGPAKIIPSDPRPIAEFTFVHKITNDTLTIFGVHLKAYPEDSTRRANSINDLRNRSKQLNSKSNYLVCGDFNIFTSTETAFQKLLDKSSPGYFVDMLNVNGNWNRNFQLAQYCTWSTRGGTNTRFDMILISKAVNESGGIDYIPNSFKIFGNDGGHFYTDVNSGSNSWFLNDPSVGASLKNASGHLPVYADFAFGVPTNIFNTKEIPASYVLYQNYPNPFNPFTIINYQLPTAGYVSLKIYDLLGKEVAVLVNEYQPAGIYNSQFLIGNSQLTSGVYFYQLKVGNFVQTKKMMLIK